MQRFLLCSTQVLLFVCIIYGNSDTLVIRNSNVIIYAEKVNHPLVIDGMLTETCWSGTNGFKDFIQRDPVEGAAPTEKTEIKLAYDVNSLYLAAKMYDSSPDSIMVRLTRRDDWTDCDNIMLCLDPYNDKRSGYYFALNAAGTQLDGVFYNDSWDDGTWDGVWEGKVHKSVFCR